MQLRLLLRLRMRLAVAVAVLLTAVCGRVARALGPESWRAGELASAKGRSAQDRSALLLRSPRGMAWLPAAHGCSTALKPTMRACGARRDGGILRL